VLEPVVVGVAPVVVEVDVEEVEDVEVLPEHPAATAAAAIAKMTLCMNRP
jgi:hypothetical protein